MIRARQVAVVFAFGALSGSRALAQSHEMMMHHGVPSRVVAEQRVGPYLASLWVEPEVGDGAVYVMLDARDGVPFTAPSGVRIAAAPASGRLGELVEEAQLETASGAGARYMAHLMFDRAERWNVRVTVEGPVGGGQLETAVESTTNAAMGLFGVLLASTPFVLVAFVYWRAWAARRRSAPALSLRPRLTRQQLD